jgi:hemoglobin
MDTKNSLFEKLGGLPTLQKVHKIFYDKIYADAWIGQYFKEIKQEIIENQQTDFMAQAMGGPEKYCGAFPIPAHQHMNINEELFEHRHQMLKDSLKEAGVAPEHAEAWLKIDGAFKKGILKNSVADCKPRFASDEILDFLSQKAFKKAS